MLTPAENERLVRVSRGTAMGETFRRYWIPVELSDLVSEPDGPPRRIRILGEDLIVCRLTDGTPALFEAFCPHRRAPMFFGRNEHNGLRCVYHGWKFDGTGSCVDMPSEPADSLFKSKVTIGTYPTWEGGGLIWAYFGPPEMQPPVPAIELVRVPPSHRFVSKTLESCNYLQALEGGLDTAHSSFAHNNDIGNEAQLRQKDRAPRITVEKTPYGYTYVGLRSAGEAEDYVRVYQYVMPSTQCRGSVMGRDGKPRDIPAIEGHIWVPVDDETTCVFNFMYAYDPAIPIPQEHAVDRERFAGRGPDDLLPNFALKKNLSNDYLIDRELQRTKTYTGIVGLNTQDYALQEGMGRIVDRSREHLGTSDRAIIALRQLLLEAAAATERGETPRGASTTVAAHVRAVDLLVPKDADWRVALRDELVPRF